RLEFHQRLDGGSKRGRVHLAGDLVALSGGVPVALLSGKRKPEERLAEVPLDALAARIENREIVLAVADAEFGRLPEPFRRLRIVRRPACRVGVDDGEIVRGQRMARLGRLEVPASCGG